MGYRRRVPNVLSLRGEIPITTLLDFQPPEVMLFAQGALAAATGDFPSEAAVTILTKASWARLILCFIVFLSKIW